MNEPHIQDKRAGISGGVGKADPVRRRIGLAGKNVRPARHRKDVSNVPGMLNAECGSPHKVTEEFCDRVKRWLDEGKGEWRI